MAVTPVSAQAPSHALKASGVNDLTAQQKSLAPKVEESTNVKISAEARARYDKDQEKKSGERIAARDALVSKIAETNRESSQQEQRSLVNAEKANSPVK